MTESIENNVPRRAVVVLFTSVLRLTRREQKFTIVNEKTRVVRNETRVHVGVRELYEIKRECTRIDENKR